MKINILGTDYTINRMDYGQDEYMDENSFAGYCDARTKAIVILNLKSLPDYDCKTDEQIRIEENATMRHEIIHAFLMESGLWSNSMQSDGAWSMNEEMVDWFALQMPKMLKAFKEADCL